MLKTRNGPPSSKPHSQAIGRMDWQSSFTAKQFSSTVPIKFQISEHHHTQLKKRLQHTLKYHGHAYSIATVNLVKRSIALVQVLGISHDVFFCFCTNNFCLISDVDPKAYRCLHEQKERHCSLELEKLHPLIIFFLKMTECSCLDIISVCL